MTRVLASSALVVAAVTSAIGCQPTLKSDLVPALAPKKTVDPGLVCQEQNPKTGTPLLVNGSGFSPAVFDVPNHPAVELPTVKLTLDHALDGTAANGGAVELSGVPGGQNANLLSWEEQDKLVIHLEDSVALASGNGAVPSGLYEIDVKNPDGRDSNVDKALAVTERPHVTTLDPPLLCVAQGDRALTVNGTGGLEVNNAVPTVTIATDALTPTLDGCTKIDQGDYDAKLCTSLAVTIPSGSLQDGDNEVEVQNPNPAACVSHDDHVSLVVVPPPAITSVAPDNVCQAAGNVTLTVTGTGFLVVNGTPFSATVNRRP